MDRSHLGYHGRLVELLLVLSAFLTSTGCVHRMLATMVYVWSGPSVPASYEGLEDRRVVVFCSAPSSIEYRHASAAYDLSKRVASLLAINVKNIDVVNPRDVENWMNETDREDFRELAKALRADMVVQVDMEQFRLEKGTKAYKGNANIAGTVYDREQGAKIAWEAPIG